MPVHDIQIQYGLRSCVVPHLNAALSPAAASTALPKAECANCVSSNQGVGSGPNLIIRSDSLSSFAIRCFALRTKQRIADIMARTMLPQAGNALAYISG